MIVWGLDLGVDDVRESTAQLLRAPLPARRGRGGLLPGHHPAPHLVVPGAPAHAGARALPDRDLRRVRVRRSGVGRLLELDGLPGSTGGSGCSCSRDCPRSRSASSRSPISTSARATPPGSSPPSVVSCRPRRGARRVPATPRAARPRRARQRPRLGLRIRQLHAPRGGLRAHVLRPRPRPGSDRLHGLRGRRARGDPVRLRDGSDDPRLAPARRADGAHAHGRRGHGHHRVRAVAAPPDARDHAGGGGAPRRAPALLDRPDRAPRRHRCRGRDRPDRGAGKSRRLRRPGVHGYRRGPDRRLRAAARHARVPARGGWPAHRPCVSAITGAPAQPLPR